MKIDSKLNTFLEKRVREGKSIRSLSEELKVPENKLRDWELEYQENIFELKAAEYDRLVEEFKLSEINRFRYRAELYNRLRAELDKRDFSGLPTDKLYSIYNDIDLKLALEIQRHKNEYWDDDWDDYDEYDDYDEFDDFDDDDELI